MIDRRVWQIIRPADRQINRGQASAVADRFFRSRVKVAGAKIRGRSIARAAEDFYAWGGQRGVQSSIYKRRFGESATLQPLILHLEDSVVSP